MGELDDLEAAGTGVAATSEDESDGDGVLDDAEGRALAREEIETLDRVLERVDLMDALDDLAAGGTGGFATGIEIIGEQMAHSPYDDLLDAFEPVRDLADHSDLLDDLF